MKILVTGGLGFIGHNAVAQLESRGCNSHRVLFKMGKIDYVREMDAIGARNALQ